MAYAARALASSMYERDWSAAEQDFQRAFMLNSNDATAHHWYAEHLINVDRQSAPSPNWSAQGKSTHCHSRSTARLGVFIGMSADTTNQSNSAGRRSVWTLVCARSLVSGLGQSGRRHYTEAVAEMQRANALGTTPLYACGLGYAHAATR